MALISKRELRQLMQLHYVFELILAFAYIIIKSTVFGTNEYTSVSKGSDWIGGTIQLCMDCSGVSILIKHNFLSIKSIQGETELLMFTFILIAFKTRRRGHVNFLPYLSSACNMAKVGNFLLFFFAKPMYGLTYSAILLGKPLIM